MRHGVFGTKFSRTKNERRRLLAGLARDVLLHGSIKTTHARAKAAQPVVEKLITRAKRGGDTNRRRILRVIGDTRVVDGLLEDAKTRFANRKSGFTRVIRLGSRLGDAAEEVLLQFVDEKIIAEVITPKKEEKTIKAQKVVKKAKKPVEKKSKRAAK
ncbi:50S ribosomal protein L17 [Candidatus Gottesmanbacteria bacterium RIFCSPLOWO2_01_FULL_48_11]|uniref:50S ribosomal protein L17 n=2 Tax=Candidatus Gottesmaniibacteriota TaxID=1752720 RepID=A0A0G1U2I2_9BACT|nr:MAG: 50S ribosomal protein L17 [Candidatus Gottesmanbacteria bacterium GW2011_GWA2_47_9]OGG28441.1 MAG: 50S ribosomal protein L17 [Candidatus Gottesmanbacteria bacterium RIFCSPLOWO2_01_FULL_48_11]